MEKKTNAMKKDPFYRKTIHPKMGKDPRNVER